MDPTPLDPAEPQAPSDDDDTDALDEVLAVDMFKLAAVEDAICLGLGTLELLRRVRQSLARMAAFLGWIHEHPEYYSVDRQVEIARSIGRQQRALRSLVEVTMQEERMRGSEVPPEMVVKLKELFLEDVLRVLRECVPVQLAERFEAKLEARLGCLPKRHKYCAARRPDDFQI